MAERGHCQECGRRIAITKSGKIKGHRHKQLGPYGAAGMSCPGAGRACETEAPR